MKRPTDRNPSMPSKAKAAAVLKHGVQFEMAKRLIEAVSLFQDVARRQVEIDIRQCQLALCERKMMQENPPSDEILSPEEREARIKEIFGL